MVRPLQSSRVKKINNNKTSTQTLTHNTVTRRVEMNLRGWEEDRLQLGGFPNSHGAGLLHSACLCLLLRDPWTSATRLRLLHDSQDSWEKATTCSVNVSRGWVRWNRDNTPLLFDTPYFWLSFQDESCSVHVNKRSEPRHKEPVNSFINSRSLLICSSGKFYSASSSRCIFCVQWFQIMI